MNDDQADDLWKVGSAALQEILLHAVECVRVPLFECHWCDHFYEFSSTSLESYTSHYSGVNRIS